MSNYLSVSTQWCNISAEKSNPRAAACVETDRTSHPRRLSRRPRNLFKFQIARAAIKKSEFSARESDWWRRSRLTLSTAGPIFWHLLSNTHRDVYTQTPKTNFELRYLHSAPGDSIIFGGEKAQEAAANAHHSLTLDAWQKKTLITRFSKNKNWSSENNWLTKFSTWF